MMHKVIFDLETTGFPSQPNKNSFFDPSDYNKYNSSRVIQLGYIILNEKNEVILKKSYLVQPTFKIENAHIHGITEEKTRQYGLELDMVLSKFNRDIQNCRLLISHNLSFDKNILLAETYRRNFDALKNKILSMDTYCTMLNGMNSLKLNKYPKLIELSKYFYPNENWVQVHDALNDCERCLKCYLKLIE